MNLLKKALLHTKYLLKPHYFFLAMVLVFACRDQPANTPDQPLGKDSAVVLAQPGPNPDTTWTDLYIPRAGFAKKNIAASLQTNFWLPGKMKYDSSYYFEGNFLIVRDAAAKVADTLALSELDIYDPADLEIVDMTDSLKFNSPLLQVKWRGNSDVEYCQFVTWQGDSLKALFEVEMLHSIRRIDANTLGGFYTSRDEVVYTFQHDYPFTISLPDYEEKYETPAIQFIGYTSEVLSSFKASKYSVDGPAITVKKGTHIHVDTIYRATKTVRLIVKDSIPVFIEIDKLKDKINTNTAG